MSRFMRNTTILAKVETTYGTDAVPTGAANAMLVSDCTISPMADNVDRSLIRSYMGSSEQLVGTKHIEISMTLELQNGGTAGTAPAWGPVARACGLAESVLATPDRVEYTPVSSGFESVSIYYYVDGVVYKALGCRGSIDFALGVGERPTMQVKMVGIDGGVAEATPSGVDYSGFKTPLVVTESNTGDFLLGCTYASGALSSGTSYVSRGLKVSLGADARFTPTLGGETVEIVDRATTGSMTLDLTAAQEVAMKAAIDANTLTSVGFLHGTTEGYKALFYAPAVQRINPKHEDVNGLAMLAMDLRFTPSSGNDELRIVLL